LFVFLVSQVFLKEVITVFLDQTLPLLLVYHLEVILDSRWRLFELLEFVLIHLEVHV